MFVASESSVPDLALSVSPWAWAAFLVVLSVALLVDLLVVNREAHAPSVRESAITSVVWVSFGLAFAFVVWFAYGGAAAGQYLAGYVVEKSLSVDNVFVWAALLGYFAVPRQYQHRVLFWGIFGAIALRAAFIFAGVAILSRFSWVEYVFGAFLLVTAVKVARGSSEEVHPERNPVLRAMRRVIPVSADYDGHRLWTRERGRLKATPLFVVLVLIEATDVVFAVDSVPAILAISREQFIVFTSNAMAIMGLRALYFLVSGAAVHLVHLDKGLGVILAMVGLKMLAARWVHVPTLWSLAAIVGVLAVTIAASLLAGRAETHDPTPPPSEPPTPEPSAPAGQGEVSR
ncbi:MAG: TerC family protein [Acidimicrobiia bacterium]|nr:TerC family protein [Acidimicrobiia bacterium]